MGNASLIMKMSGKITSVSDSIQCINIATLGSGDSDYENQ
jgi:hypothetical protein